jgi:hypothetical protein
LQAVVCRRLSMLGSSYIEKFECFGVGYGRSV